MTSPMDESERLLRFVYLSPVGTVHLQRDGTIELINPAAVALLMPIASGGDLANLFTLLAPFAPSLRATVEGHTAETGTILERTQIRLGHGDVPSVVVALTIVAIDRDECSAVLLDITKETEQARKLHTQEQRLRAIINGAQDYAIFTLDRTGRVDEWNRSLGRFTDIPRDRVIGMMLSMLFDAPPTIEPQSLLEEALQKGGARFEGRMPSHGTSQRTAQAIVSPLIDIDGVPTGFGVVLHDTTARTEHEQRLVKLATTDPLTGMMNRRSFLEAAELELRRSTRYGRPLSVLMIDVDHFKSVNDRFGHDVGDRVLIALAQACRRTVREVDLVARLGGEEFAILAPETALANAGLLGERLRAAISALEVPTPTGILRITASIGVASRSADPTDSFAEILKRSDLALYEAKGTGRDRVVLEGNAP